MTGVSGENVSQTIFEDLFHVTAAMQNGNYLQRLGIVPIYDQVRVDREELHLLVRQVPAPMAGTRTMRQESDSVRITDSTRSAIATLLWFLM
jgi:hypothetical protein